MIHDVLKVWRHDHGPSNARAIVKRTFTQIKAQKHFRTPICKKKQKKTESSDIKCDKFLNHHQSPHPSYTEKSDTTTSSSAFGTTYFLLVTFEGKGLGVFVLLSRTEPVFIPFFMIFCSFFSSVQFSFQQFFKYFF